MKQLVVVIVDSLPFVGRVELIKPSNTQNAGGAYGEYYGEGDYTIGTPGGTPGDPLVEDTTKCPASTSTSSNIESDWSWVRFFDFPDYASAPETDGVTVSGKSPLLILCNMSVCKLLQARDT
jgi:hypothetical protein